MIFCSLWENALEPMSQVSYTFLSFKKETMSLFNFEITYCISIIFLRKTGFSYNIFLTSCNHSAISINSIPKQQNPSYPPQKKRNKKPTSIREKKKKTKKKEKVIIVIQTPNKQKLKKITPKSVKQGKCLLVATQNRWIDYELLRKSEVTKKSLKCTVDSIISVLLLYM